MQTNYSRNTRQTAYTGNNLDDFSRFMYHYKDRANKGFTCIDIDWIFRNHIKQSFTLFEIKTRCGSLTYSQEKAFLELNEVCKKGSEAIKYKFVGFYVLQFENTIFSNGKAWANGKLITEADFLHFLDTYF